MRKIYLLPILLLSSLSYAQSQHSYWSIGINPLGILEPIHAIGPCASYRISPRLELWEEISYLFSGDNNIEEWKNLKGYRFLFQPRYYVGSSKKFFIAPEFRLKHYTYNATGSFTNTANPDTLVTLPYKGSQVLSGGAFVAGTQLVLSHRHQLYFEITAGIGSKYRYIKRLGLPAGSMNVTPVSKSALSPKYNEERNDPYFPLGFRLLWKLNNK